MIAFILFIFSHSVARAADCGDWVDHSRLDHDVHILSSRPGVVIDTMKTISIPKSELTLMLPKDNWTVVHSSADLPDGVAFAQPAWLWSKN